MVQKKKINWGEIGYIVFKRTYARKLKEYRELRKDLKWSTAGRFMWQLGTKTVDKLGLPSLQNCAFTIVNEPIRPFTWTFELLMLGAGKQTMPLCMVTYN